MKNGVFIMPSFNLVPVNGVIQSVTEFNNNCCMLMTAVRNSDGITNFVVSPDTYVIGEVRLRAGMNVTAFYDVDLPVPLIFPPQYQAMFIGRRNPQETVYAGVFDDNLEALDGSLKLNIGRSTQIVTSNGQPFNCPLSGQTLIVYYSATTRSIPPQTTPRKIIVIC